MKKIVLILLSFVSTIVQSNWELKAVYVANDSTLRCVSAYRMKNGKKHFTYIDTKIKNASKKPVMMIGYPVPKNSQSQGVLHIVLQDSKDITKTYELSVDCQSAQAVATGRSKTKKIAKNMPDFVEKSDVSVMHSDDLIARAYFKEGDNLLASDQKNYGVEEEDVAFDVIIQDGGQGHFTVHLSKPVDVILN